MPTATATAPKRNPVKPVIASPSSKQKIRTSNTRDLYNEINIRAKEIYLARKGAVGSALEDWLQAEKEIKGKEVNHA